MVGLTFTVILNDIRSFALDFSTTLDLRHYFAAFNTVHLPSSFCFSDRQVGDDRVQEVQVACVQDFELQREETVCLS